MKALLSMFPLIVALASPVYAQDVTKQTTEAGCTKAGGMWNAQTSECAEQSAKMGKEKGTHEGANGATPKSETQKMDQSR
jgi:hypothetical protein